MHTDHFLTEHHEDSIERLLNTVCFSGIKAKLFIIGKLRILNVLISYSKNTIYTRNILYKNRKMQETKQHVFVFSKQYTDLSRVLNTLSI